MRRDLVLLAVCLLTSPIHAENWPQWRGPRGDGTSAETSLPIEWSLSKNIRWSRPLPEGASSPCVWSDAVFVTGQRGDEYSLFRIDADKGKIAWERPIGRGSIIQDVPTAPRTDRGFQKFHRLHNLASPTPATEGSTVVAHFGSGILVAFDFTGRELWRHDLQQQHGRYTIWWGHANSPIIFGGLVINVCMQDSLLDKPDQKPGVSYLIAHDLRTGTMRWKTMRETVAKDEQCDSYATPIVRTENGRDELVVMGGNQLDAYEPSTGKQLWHLPGLVGGRTISGPTLGGGLVFATQGMRGPLSAVRPGAGGPLAREQIVWQMKQGTSDSASPVCWKGLLFWITDNGIAHCADAATGKLHWKERLAGDFKASPLAANDRVYFSNLAGKTFVVKAAVQFEVLAESAIPDELVASPAAADGRIYLRGRKALFCVGE